MNFNKIFNPTEEELEEQQKWIKELFEESKKKRENIKFIKSKESNLYQSEPFKSFLGDCRYCSFYIDGPPVTEGGWCKKTNEGCGYGFTCKDNDSKWAIKLEENKNILRS